MFTLTSVQRPVLADTWQDNLVRITDERFSRTINLVPPADQALLLMGRVEMMRHRALDIYQMLDLQKGLIELQSNQLSQDYNLIPNRIIIRKPKRIYMGFERSENVEADELALRSLISKISGRETDKPTRFTNIALGFVADSGSQPQLHGEIIHALTDEVMPEYVSFGRLAITGIKAEQHQTLESLVTLT